MSGLRPLGGRLAALVAVAATATFAGTAHAAVEPPAPGDSAVIQYAELVPTGGGARAPGIGKKTQSPLPKKAKRALDKAPKQQASTLAVVATSSDYGAPSTTPATPKPVTTPKPIPRATPSPAEEPSLNGTLAATAVAAAPVRDARMIGLLVALVAIAVAGGALSARAHRS